MKRNLPRTVCVLTLLFCGSPALWAAEGDSAILRDDAAPQADSTVLLAEAHLFDTIRKGVALSLAECELQAQGACEPTVNREELQQVMDKLDNRINLLAARHDQTGEKSLEEVLLTYANVRDDYKKFMDKLDEISPAKPEDTGENVFDLFGNAPTSATQLPGSYSVFEDADQPIRDDDAQPQNAPASAPTEPKQ